MGKVEEDCFAFNIEGIDFFVVRQNDHKWVIKKRADEIWPFYVKNIKTFSPKHCFADEVLVYLSKQEF